MRLIDADALYDIVIDSIKPMTTNEAIILQDFVALLEDAPTVDAEPIVHGHWVRDFSITEDTFYKCSVCGRQECLMEKYDPKVEMPYCHCGAKMDEEEENA